MIAHLRKIAGGDSVTQDQARALMALILEGQAEPEQTGALLGLLHAHRISAPLLAGFATELERRGVRVEVDESLLNQLVDVCGTGGDSVAGASTFNVSTTVAFLAAACGLPIAKHGNRAVSSRSGSFDVLEALRIPFALDAKSARQQLEANRMTFLFAPAFQPGLKQIGLIRRSLGFRTVFNALGPLLNPVKVRRQLVGVYSRDLVMPMIEALQLLGATDAMVVHGEDGLDELSLCAPTHIAHLADGEIRASIFSPEQIGLKFCQHHELSGGEPAENARIIESVLGGEPGPRADLTCLNVAGALLVGGRVHSLAAGFEMARATQRTGKALELLRRQQLPKSPAAQTKKDE